jgi:GTP-binding protein
MSIFHNAAYALSAHSLRDLPPPGPAEIAFAGRSNAGKSSAINTLVRHRRLAYVSKTPGRTQMINFFRLPGGGLLADLPGYGYAKVPASVRAHWGQVLSTYLQTRTCLVGLVLIVDARHPLGELDQRMLDWFQPSGKPVHVLLTKSDKLGRREANQTLGDVRRRLAEWAPNYTAQLFSSLNATGTDEAEAVLAPWLAQPAVVDPVEPVESADALAQRTEKSPG